MPAHATSPTATPSPAPGEPTFGDRLVAEAVRAYEQDGAQPIEDAAALRAARQAAHTDGREGDLERRVVTRARSVGVAAALVRALDRMRWGGTWAVGLGMALMALAGAAAARTAMHAMPGQTVNVFWTLGALLGVQSALLIVWLAVMLVRPSAAGQGSLGAWVMGAGRWIASRVHRSAEQLAAAEAATGVLLRSGVGPWLFGTVSHALWVAFNVGCLVMLLVLLGVRYYVFAWETTILSPEVYVNATRALAALPDLVGFATPNDAQVTATQAPADAEALDDARWAWASLLVGSLVIYGLAPRLLLALLCAMVWRRKQIAYRLDLAQPGYARLRNRLAPATRSLGVVEPVDERQAPAPAATKAEQSRPERPAGPPAILGLEIDEPGAGWPPPVADVAWRDLGFVDDRERRREVIDALRDDVAEPATLVVVCALSGTPDRGLERYLGELRGQVRRSPALLLTAGHALRQRSGAAAVDRRLAQWRELAARAGIDPARVLELDLDHLTDASLAALAAMLPADAPDDADATVHESTTGPTRHIEAAFARIADRCRHWSAPPDAAQQAKLHRDIAQLYRRGQHPAGAWGITSRAGGGWPSALSLPPDPSVGDWPRHMRDSAQRVVELLPPALRLRPRWLAAGAASGALGCLAAAALLSPAAIVALPTWSLLGAAIAAATQPRGVSDKPIVEDDALASHDFTEAVDAAALFAMLLELQGRGEETISRVLERALGDVDDARRIASADDASRWLDELRHRFDLALAEVQR